jgi:ribosomal protein S18 acetylase RimI-like enzyme
MANCQIRNNEYFAPNGQESILYKELESKVGKAQAEDLFVLAYTPQFNKRVIVPIVGKYKNKIPKAPENVTFNQVYTKQFRTIEIKEDGKKVGRIQLVKFKDGYKVKSSLLDVDKQGRGLGRILYAEALRRLINEGQNLYSDAVRTPQADKTWEYFKSLGFVDETGRIMNARPLTHFDKNGEPLAKGVIMMASQMNEVNEPLSFVEQQEIRMAMAEFPEVEDSEQFLSQLQKAFYKEGMFNPTDKSLSEMYTKFEREAILEDVNLLARIKETVEKLKRTENIENTVSTPNVYRTNQTNLIGKLTTLNPYIVEQDIIEEFAGEENPDLSEALNKELKLKALKKVPTIDENGNEVVLQPFYDNSIKDKFNPNLKPAIIQLANSDFNSEKSLVVADKITNWLYSNGINIQGFTQELLPSLYNLIDKTSQQTLNTFKEAYNEMFGQPKIREKVIKTENKDRDLVYLETNKTEQQLFDELNLIQTEQANIYHRIERVEFEELKNYLKSDENITELQAYKDYFEYDVTPSIESKRFEPTTLEKSLEYYSNQFVADISAEKLKNPNGMLDKFIITEKGVELKYADPLSIAEIKAYIADGTKFAKEIEEYSTIAKHMPNLTEVLPVVVENKFMSRVKAVNNFKSVAKPNTEVEKLNNEVVLVKNDSKDFLNVDNELFELVNREGNMSVYYKIAKNEDLNFFETNPAESADYLNQVKINQPLIDKFNKIKKKWNEESLGDNFDCV